MDLRIKVLLRFLFVFFLTFDYTVFNHAISRNQYNEPHIPITQLINQPYTMATLLYITQLCFLIYKMLVLVKGEYSGIILVSSKQFFEEINNVNSRCKVLHLEWLSNDVQLYIAQETIFSHLGQTMTEDNIRKGFKYMCIYIYGWITLLYSRNLHNTVNQLQHFFK